MQALVGISLPGSTLRHRIVVMVGSDVHDTIDLAPDATLETAIGELRERGWTVDRDTLKPVSAAFPHFWTGDFTRDETTPTDEELLAAIRRGIWDGSIIEVTPEWLAAQRAALAAGE